MFYAPNMNLPLRDRTNECVRELPDSNNTLRVICDIVYNIFYTKPYI
jgi:hypothetical protein